MLQACANVIAPGTNFNAQSPLPCGWQHFFD
jgi:hypothetical protein